MVEVVVRHLVILGRPGHEQHRIRLETGQLQHRHQQRRLVAADAVTLVEGHRHVVRLVAGGLGFGGDAHIADLLGDELEERHYLLLRRLRVFGQLTDFGFDFGSHRIQPGTAERVVPLGNLVPVGGSADHQALYAGVKLRHVRFGNHLRHIRRDPRVENAAVLLLLRKLHGAADRVFDRDGLERPVRRSVDGDPVLQHRGVALQQIEAAPDAGHPRLDLLFHRPEPDDVADLQLRNRDGHDLVGGVVDIGTHLAGAHRDFAVLRDIQPDRLAVRLQHVAEFQFELLVGGVEIEALRPHRAPSGLGQHFHEIVVGGDGGAVGLIDHVLLIVQQHAVGVREAFHTCLFGQFLRLRDRGRNRFRK